MKFLLNKKNAFSAFYVNEASVGRSKVFKNLDVGSCAVFVGCM